MSDKREFDAGIDLDDDEVFEYATARLDEVNEAQLAREYELDDSDQDYIKTLYVDPPFSEKAKYELLTNPLPYVSALATGAVLFAGFRAFKNNQRHLYQPLMRARVAMQAVTLGFACAKPALGYPIWFNTDHIEKPKMRPMVPGGRYE